MVAQLLLEEIDHAQSLLVGTIAKHASQYIHNTLSDDVGSYRTDCITANVIFDSYRIRPELCPTTLLSMLEPRLLLKTLEETAHSITSSFYYLLVIVSLCSQVCTIPDRMQVLSNWILLESIKMIFRAKRLNSVVHSSSPFQ